MAPTPPPIIALITTPGTATSGLNCFMTTIMIIAQTIGKIAFFIKSPPSNWSNINLRIF